MVASNQDEQAEREATDWFARLRSRSISTEELTDFARWRRDPANACAYERVETLWDTSYRLKHDPDIHAALGQAMGRGRVRRWLTHIATNRTTLTVGAGLAVLVVVIIMMPLQMPWRPTVYQTGIGERSVVQLEDGSRVQLDTNSRLTPHVTTRERHVDLGSGQAYFEVHHDPAHPFVVEVGNRMTVTALGTRFDIRRDDGFVVVSLFAGSVAVVDTISGERVCLAPGQSVSMIGDTLGRIGAIPAASQPGWRDGRLSFHDTPLGTALGEINRYTSRPLRLARSDAADHPVSGDFSTDDVDGFAAAANAIFGTGTVVRDAGSGEG